MPIPETVSPTNYPIHVAEVLILCLVCCLVTQAMAVDGAGNVYVVE
jgi:hypothetical protein